MSHNPNWKIKNLGGRSAEVLLYDEIGGWFGTEARAFAEEISDLDVDALTVRVNSPGGDVWDGLAIMNSLRRHTARVTVVVEGIAASAASFIAVGGADELVMAPHSEMMIHDAIGLCIGNAEDMERMKSDLDRESDNIAAIYARRAGTAAEEWREAMRAESWFTAEEAVETGLADRVDEDEPEDQLSPTARSRSRVMASFKYGSRREAPRPPVLAHAGRNEKEPDMAFLNEVAKRLGLTAAELDEKTVLNALEETLDEQANDNDDADTGQDTASADAEDALPPTDAEGEGEEDPKESESGETSDQGEGAGDVSEADGLTVVVDAAQLAELEAEAAYGREARERAAKDEAEKIVNQAVADGKIGAAAKPRWVEALLTDPEDAKARLNQIRKGLVHRSETGHAQEPSSSDDGEKYNALTAAFGLGR